VATGKKVLSSSILLVLVKVVQRSLGLVSTLILARILFPEDFGIVAIAAITLQLATILSNSGIRQYIPQKDEVDNEDVNTAWTIDVLMKFALWVLMLLGAPLIGDFYGNAQVVGAIQVVSVVIFLRALQNPGLHLLRRSLNYKTIFWLQSIQKLTSFAVVVSVALATRSYWSIIIGDIVYALVGVLGSYMLHPYRPRLSLQRWLEQWSFTKWMFLRGIMGFLRSQLDNLMVSKIFTIGELGTYSIIRGISVLPATDIIAPAAEPLLSSFSRVKHDRLALDHQFRTSLLIAFLIIMPICIVLAKFSDALVFVLLGERWKDQGPLLANLTILLFSFSLGSLLGNLYIAMGKVRLIFFYNVVSLTFIFSFLLVLYENDLAEFALLRGILGLISTLLWMLLALYFTGSRMLSFTMVIVFPVLAISLVTVFLAELLVLPIDSIYLSLAWNLATFGVVYILLVGISYLAILNRYREWQYLQQLLSGILVRFGKRPG